jgi:D-alanyl-D-alanine carboxypeptidase
VRRRVPVSRDTRVAIASVTKPFVAGLVVQLAATGVLDLDDPLSRWAPRFRPSV